MTERFAPLIFLVALMGFFLISLSREIDSATLPPNHGVGVRTLLRKTYSVIAFALLGYLLSSSHRRTGTLWLLGSGVAIGAFSATIELFQHQMGATEGLVWNAADTLMGLLGGLLGSLFYARPKKWL